MLNTKKNRRTRESTESHYETLSSSNSRINNQIAYQATGTLFSSVINLVNTTIGAGILAMPFALKQNSILSGLLLIIISGSLSGFGLFLQGKCSFYAPSRQSSFFALASQTYPSLSIFFDIAIAIKCFGAGVSYLIIVGDLMPQVMKSLFNINSDEALMSFILYRQFWVLASAIIVVPLSYLRKIDSLKYTSFVALSSVGYLVSLVTICYLFSDISQTRDSISLFIPQRFSNILSTLPIIVFAFTCHQNMFSVVNELKHRTPSIINNAIGLSISISCFFYCLVALCGYLSFGDSVGGNIVLMYPSSIATELARICIAVMVILSYPLQCHPCRASLNHTYQWILQKNLFNFTFEKIPWKRLKSPENELEGNYSPSDFTSISTLRFVVITTIIVVGSYTAAFFVESLEFMLSLVGSTGSTSISFILPGLFAYKLIGADASTRYDIILKYSGLALCIYGIMIMALCLSTNIFLFIGNNDSL